ncbi:MAG: hypothetical protein Q9217_005975 [Psora testacea]
MANVVGSQLLRPAKQSLRKGGRPILRRDPGPLSKDTLLVKKPIERGPSLPKKRVEQATPAKYGQHIYMYNNIHTNQVVYSLTRHLNNNKSLAQLPFLGKKTRPAKLRKDLWLPYCLASFPSPYAGLEAYRALREYRRLHETAYDPDIITEKYGEHRGQLLPTKKRGKVLMDQKANSIADLAAVLLQQEEGPSKERLESAERRIKRVEKLKKQKGGRNVNKRPVDLRKELEGVGGVTVRWANLQDADFAETWPMDVEHDVLERSRYTAAFPILEKVLGEGEVDA